jgi:hypothetical protein
MPGLNPIRIACIGCGFIGRRHMENVALMEGVTPAAFADANLSAAEAFSHDFGGSYATDNVERIFADPAIDAVIIATHHDSHTPLALCAAASRKHILLEKPMADLFVFSIEEGEFPLEDTHMVRQMARRRIRPERVMKVESGLTLLLAVALCARWSPAITKCCAILRTRHELS